MRELRSSNELLSANCSRLLQERLEADGYLLFRELLDREAVLALRRRIREALHDLNWINSKQDSECDLKVQAAPKETTKLDAHEWPIFDRVQKLEEFHALPHSAALISALEKIFGESVLMHPRHICRVHFPAQEANRTLPHQDYPYVQGDVVMLVCSCAFTHKCTHVFITHVCTLARRTGALARAHTHTRAYIFIHHPTYSLLHMLIHTHALAHQAPSYSHSSYHICLSICRV
jgi:ectoine hydroxylase-related dioxygenase (phytanoyl-CoA dioxygenase family)